MTKTKAFIFHNKYYITFQDHFSNQTVLDRTNSTRQGFKGTAQMDWVWVQNAVSLMENRSDIHYHTITPTNAVILQW